MLKQIRQILTFNRKAGLLDLPYNPMKEAEYCIEEALEGFDTTYLANKLHLHEDATPKDLSRAIVTGCCKLPDEGLPEVDAFDKHLDGIVFNFGALFKLNLTIPAIFRGLESVMIANLTKLIVGKDEHGKQMKPEGFVGPEIELQKILDERRN